jgi:hypothetical protein
MNENKNKKYLILWLGKYGVSFAMKGSTTEHVCSLYLYGRTVNFLCVEKWGIIYVKKKYYMVPV